MDHTVEIYQRTDIFDYRYGLIVIQMVKNHVDERIVYESNKRLQTIGAKAPQSEP